MADRAGDSSEIVFVESEAELQDVRGLVAELIAWDRVETARLGLDDQLVAEFYHGGGDELETLGKFSPPDGRFLLALARGRPAGCIAFHRMSEAICEMKNMYVRPEFRGLGIARSLALHLLTAARQARYRTMRLETTRFMGGALALYGSLGFRERDPYYEIPESFLPVTVFMEIELLETST